METRFTIMRWGNWRFQKDCLQERKEKKETGKASDVFELVKEQFTFLADSVGWVSESITE